MNFVSQTRDFAFKMIDFAGLHRESPRFVLNMKNFGLKTDEFALKTMNFVSLKRCPSRCSFGWSANDKTSRWRLCDSVSQAPNLRLMRHHHWNRSYLNRWLQGTLTAARAC